MLPGPLLLIVVSFYLSFSSFAQCEQKFVPLNYLRPKDEMFDCRTEWKQEQRESKRDTNAQNSRLNRLFFCNPVIFYLLKPNKDTVLETGKESVLILGSGIQPRT